MLSTLPPDEQAAALGKLNPDDDCVGTSAFFRGMGLGNAAYWSVQCKNGRSYQIEIKADAAGRTTSLDCSLAKALGIDCFKTFEEENRASKAKDEERAHRVYRDPGAINICPPPHKMTRDGCQ
jgi:hypothetical protein